MTPRRLRRGLGWWRPRGGRAGSAWLAGGGLDAVLAGLADGSRPDGVAAARAVLLLVHHARVTLEAASHDDLTGAEVELGLAAMDLRRLSGLIGQVQRQALAAAACRTVRVDQPAPGSEDNGRGRRWLRDAGS